MFILQERPNHPRHVTVDGDGIPYSQPTSLGAEPLPARFQGPARPDDSEGPPWATLIFGLETGRDQLRTRFLTMLQRDAEAGRSLVRYGDALESAFRTTFGGRGATPEASDFLSFVATASAEASHPAEREQLARGSRRLDEHRLDPRILRLGAHGVGFGLESGHWPPDHPEVMYWLSALVPGWRDVHFDQQATDEDCESFVLEAWCRGQALRAAAENRDDWIDAWSCAGLVNVLLRDVIASDVRVCLRSEDESVLAVAGPRAVLQQLRADGLFSTDGDD